MDSDLRLRLDLGLVLLAVIAGATAAAGYGVTDGATVAASIILAAVSAVLVLFLGTTPQWARDAPVDDD
jgi:predicted Na+-dependent transporter